MGVCEIVFAGRDPVWSQLESGGLKARGRETSCSSKHGVHAEADAGRGPGRVGQGCQCHPSRRCKRYLRGRCRNWECRYHSLGTLGCKVRLIYNYLLLIVSVTIILLLHKIQTSHLYYHHVFSEAGWRPINVYYIDPLGFPISRQSAIESAQIPSVDMHACFCVVWILDWILIQIYHLYYIDPLRFSISKSERNGICSDTICRHACMHVFCVWILEWILIQIYCVYYIDPLGFPISHQSAIDLLRYHL
jgi:hypothetical protein